MLRARLFHASAIVAALALAGAAGMVAAQSTPTDTIDTNAPVDASGSYQIDGVMVDVTGPNAEAARYAGWRVAQRKGYQMLAKKMGTAGGVPSDSVLDSMVTGIVIENEQIGPNRYIAKLGVLFSRGKIGGMLGVGGEGTRSQPMVLVPIQWSGGAATAFEQKTAWQDAWGRFRAGDSAVDYVRPIGAGPDSLLLNEGQIGRRDRGWWRSVLDQYAASDVLTPVVTLSRQWPGGPVIGVFEARHGADNHVLARFTLRVESEDGLTALLDAGVKRMDTIYQNALKGGGLAYDPSLAYIAPPMPTPTATPEATDTPGDTIVTSETPTATTGTASMTIQFDTPTAGSVSSIEAAVRGVPGVTGASTTSMAIGGVSVMRLNYSGDPEVLRTSLQSRGFQVGRNGTTLRIRRAEPAPGE
ncbi:heavy-metal-associated domain-containing protein [Sphingomonas panacisoli]|uniref:Heavy-metal-associated domain-containing protein n=1 Tax=Sphingomonas panacisoli TaxID=1813879 RepID=A0A5B8LIX7_9SPHN|nr:heavy-metal-associated domain-containing protein [Sphingomonas panacisoli]QDZ07552.1 heavy-metal-associated domain-containing protein [Sphingomonas panacisoli]